MRRRAKFRRFAARRQIEEPKLRGGGEMTCAPEDVTRSTARPRSLVPSARKRNSPSMPEKPEGLVNVFRREPLRALGLHQRGDQRDRVIGERCGAHRVLFVAGAIALREVAVTGSIGAAYQPPSTAGTE